MLTKGQESTQEISMPLDENMAFNLMIWANSLIGTGNSDYQNEFYKKQADKIRKNYELLIG